MNWPLLSKAQARLVYLHNINLLKSLERSALRVSARVVCLPGRFPGRIRPVGSQ